MNFGFLKNFIFENIKLFYVKSVYKTETEGMRGHKQRMVYMPYIIYVFHVLRVKMYFFMIQE